MAEDNLSAVLHGKMDLRMEQMPVSDPKPGEVLVSMRCCGLCRTDSHLWENGFCGDFVVKDPIVLGHESSGVVVKCGQGVKDLKPGDHVALELGVSCGRCTNCRSGHYNVCKPFSLNALARFMCHPAHQCHKIPEGVSFEQAALIEPLAVSVRAVTRIGVTLGSVVLICGAGAIGLCSILAAKACGAAKVCITDLEETRLELAKKMGADFVYKADGSLARDQAQRVVDMLGARPDYTIECTGAEPSFKMAIYATQSGGGLIAVGLDPPEVTIPIVDAAVREVDIKGTYSYTSQDYKRAISLVASGRCDPSPMVTHRYDLEDTLEAFRRMEKPDPGMLKLMVNCVRAK